MTVTENTALARMRRGEIASGLIVRQARTVDIAKIAKASGHDWLMIDLEHSSLDLDLACQLCVAALDTGVTPIVRVPSHDQFQAARVLDGGAMGVIVPHVNNAEQARAVVANCKYPPVGHRSLSGAAPQLDFAALSPAEAIETLNAQMMLIVMLETPEAIENADEIAAVEGIDVLLIGSNDLTAEMGIPGQYAHERVREAFQRTADAARKHGKFAGIGGIYDEEIAARYIALGFRFVLAGSDYGFLMAGAKARSAFLRKLPV